MNEAQAHEYASAKAAAYVAKFKRPMPARTVDGVYTYFFLLAMRRAEAA